MYPTTADLETAGGSKGNIPEMSMKVSALAGGLCATVEIGRKKNDDHNNTAAVKLRTIAPFSEQNGGEYIRSLTPATV
jgi:hypothetical protein